MTSHVAYVVCVYLRRAVSLLVCQLTHKPPTMIKEVIIGFFLATWGQRNRLQKQYHVASWNSKHLHFLDYLNIAESQSDISFSISIHLELAGYSSTSPIGPAYILNLTDTINYLHFTDRKKVLHHNLIKTKCCAPSPVEHKWNSYLA